MPTVEVLPQSLTVHPALRRWQRPLKIVNNASSTILAFGYTRQQPSTSLRAKYGISGFTVNSDMRRLLTVSPLRSMTLQKSTQRSPFAAYALWDYTKRAASGHDTNITPYPSAFSIPLISTIIRGNREKGIRGDGTDSPLRFGLCHCASLGRRCRLPLRLRLRPCFAGPLLRASPLPLRYAPGCPNRSASLRLKMHRCAPFHSACVCVSCRCAKIHQSR